jgi:epoxyqueuosine reductase QueG
MEMKAFIEKRIKDYVKNYPKVKNTQSRWEEPLICFADAKDPLFPKFQKIISPSHALPTDFLKDAQTVIAYFLPFEGAIAESNIEGRESSKDWAVAYIETNQLILDLNTYMKDVFQELGYHSTIVPATHNFDKTKLISDWSHRHAAYVAGLGKFGINNMLITEKGCCGRFGSIVTNCKIEATKREDKEFCLYKAKGICAKCVQRCVNDALKIEGFDRHKCYEMCLYNNEIHGDMGLTDVCGKCMVNIPCSFKNPMGF